MAQSSVLNSETEGPIIAAQEQGLAKRSYQAKIIKDVTDPMCRICNSHRYDERIDHIVSAYPELAKTCYIQKHNMTAFIYIGRHVNATIFSCQITGINTNQLSLEMKKLQYSGICRYTLIEN